MHQDLIVKQYATATDHEYLHVVLDFERLAQELQQGHEGTLLPRLGAV
jgi:hypothetical protein